MDITAFIYPIKPKIKIIFPQSLLTVVCGMEHFVIINNVIINVVLLLEFIITLSRSYKLLFI